MLRGRIHRVRKSIIGEKHCELESWTTAAVGLEMLILPRLRGIHPHSTTHGSSSRPSSPTSFLIQRCRSNTTNQIHVSKAECSLGKASKHSMSGSVVQRKGARLGLSGRDPRIKGGDMHDAESSSTLEDMSTCHPISSTQSVSQEE